MREKDGLCFVYYPQTQALFIRVRYASPVFQDASASLPQTLAEASSALSPVRGKEFYYNGTMHRVVEYDGREVSIFDLHTPSYVFAVPRLEAIEQIELMFNELDDLSNEHVDDDSDDLDE
jgi:hypothetical protein